MKKAYTLLACSVASVFFPTMLFAESTANISPRIINGSDATLGEWPSIVALVKSGQNAFDGQFCGGSFLGGRYVLTAAHCVEFMDPAKLDAVIGINNLNNEGSEGIRVPVRRIYVHEDYFNSNLVNDIAILELDREVSSPAITIADATTRTSTAAGSRMSVAGWGTTTPSGSSVYPSVLQKVDVNLQDQSTCYMAMSGLNPSGISFNPNSTNFCAGTANNEDSCRGDSGGPIIVADTGVQLGIVSWGSAVCATSGTYGVYTNISHFTNWITQKTNGFSYEQYVDEKQIPLAPFTRTFTYNNFGNNQMTYSGVRIINNPYDPSHLVSVVANSCESQTLNPNESCEITFQFSPQAYQTYQYEIDVDFSENGVSRTADTTVKFKTMRSANSEVINALSTLPKTDVLSSEQGWSVVGNELRSGVIGDSQRSELVIKGIPRGIISFNYRMSSESTDMLEVYLNGEFRGRASGYSASAVRLSLLNTDNIVEFRYVKNGSVSSGEDAAFISNLRYSSSILAESTSTTTSSSSGGSIGWFGLLLFAPLWMRRKAS
ncbi:S1 family peptidase [Vibrio mimicus]|uniref:GlyGly-CTERM sorting domain-containing protein n=1 Tax=Vibrio mimicus TaxID=674 RepID=A0A2J9V2R4_VIBMI|nr:trypsin-like serine protease [Vibrio mimicus]EEW09832.1 putative trypsin [Vibrio mimicus VM573]EGU20175.1 serine protease, trypsin family [Vibrio mimicus SX-4]KFE32198.1 GlyGly-CTERM domain protein [Vibrio mimicus]PNM58062.1 GlyGly-CTERM sorting domain-containing protein [Vibrio mimicus]TXZ77024.1 trypsin-like serine protease [Vibrio mimicus]